MSLVGSGGSPEAACHGWVAAMLADGIIQGVGAGRAQLAGGGQSVAGQAHRRHLGAQLGLYVVRVQPVTPAHECNPVRVLQTREDILCSALGITSVCEGREYITAGQARLLGAIHGNGRQYCPVKRTCGAREHEAAWRRAAGQAP